MTIKNFGAWLCMLLLICIPDVCVVANRTSAAVPIGHAEPEQPGSSEVQQITAEELKTKLQRNESVTIIDVRSTSSYIDSGNKIKGAIHVKVRRLRSRLSLPPLNSVPRNREIVTYCACPSDEASIEAAQILIDAGFKRVRVLKGGWNLWLKANGAVEPRQRG